MAKQIFFTPTTATLDDGSPFMSVVTNDPYGDIQVVTTHQTVNNLSPIKNTYLEDVHIPSTHQKAIEGDLNVLGDVFIDQGTIIPIGAELIDTAGYLYVNGFINVTGTIDNGGTILAVGTSNKTGTTIGG